MSSDLIVVLRSSLTELHHTAGVVGPPSGLLYMLSSLTPIYYYRGGGFPNDTSINNKEARKKLNSPHHVCLSRMFLAGSQDTSGQADEHFSSGCQLYICSALDERDADDEGRRKNLEEARRTSRYSSFIVATRRFTWLRNLRG